MIACVFDPGSCIPMWAKLIATYWDSLLMVVLFGVIIGGLGGWKAIVVAIGGLLALLLRRKAAPDPAWENGGDDPLAGFPKPPKRRTAKRSLPDSLTR